MARISVTFLTALLASGAISATAAAQTAPATTPQAAPPSTTTTIEVGEKQIRSFILALAEVDKIQKQFQSKLEAAPAEQRPALEQEATNRMTAAVEAQGLDPQEFSAIAAAAQGNQEMRSKIREEAAKMQDGAPTGR